MAKFFIKNIYFKGRMTKGENDRGYYGNRISVKEYL